MDLSPQCMTFCVESPPAYLRGFLFDSNIIAIEGDFSLLSNWPWL